MWTKGTFALDSGVSVPYIQRMNYNITLVVKLPAELSNALALAAELALMTKSEFVRQAIIEKLKHEAYEFPARSGL
jgi:hypothetical protein